jgi:hypothetical protein
MNKKQRISYKECHKIENNIEYKMCKECLIWYEMNKENFKVQPSQKDGFSQRCKKCQEERNHNYYMKNRDKQLAYSKAYQEANKEMVLKYQKEVVRPRNRKYINDRDRKWRKNNREYIAEYSKEYYYNNQDKFKIYNENRRHKNHNINSKEWKACKDYFKNNNGEWACAYCGMTEEEHKKLYNEQLHKEHVNNNGKNDLSNCVPGCKNCNCQKWEFSLDEWYNENNENYTKERYDKIIQWINRDYKQFIIEKKPRKPYQRKK